MNNFHLLKGVSTVVAALGLALALGAAPALADPRDPDTGCHGPLQDPHKPCGGVAENRAQAFEVALIEGDFEFGNDLVTADCLGSSKRKQVTDANFPPVDVDGCRGLTIDDGLGDIQFLHLCQINLNHKFRIDMTVTIFATSGFGVVGGVLCPNVDPAAVYQGEFPARFFNSEDCKAGNTCVVIIDLPNLTLKKSTQPNKGDEAGRFNLGNIVWDPFVE